MILGWITRHNDIRRYILCNATTALNKRPTSDVAILLDDNVTAKYSTVVYLTITGNRYFDTQNRAIPNLYIMAQVYTVHQMVFVSNTCTSFFVCSTADDHVFTNVIVITDD